MAFTLEDFEQDIDKAILKRGYDYYKNFHVNEPELLSDGKFEFIVEGSEDYTVHLTINENKVLDYDCDCPYDSGPVCKHVAAALYHMKESNSTNDKVTNKPKKQTVSEIVREILKNVSTEELAYFIEDKAMNDKGFRDMFFTAFAYKTQINQRDFFNKQIISTINSASINGYLDWNGVTLLVNTVGDMLLAAEKHIENGVYDVAFYICSALLDNICEVFEYGYDEDGDIMNLVENSFDLLRQISTKELGSEVSKMIFDYCITSFDNSIFYDWDINLGFLELSSKLVKSADDIKRLLKIIDETSLSTYELERVQPIIYEILKKQKSEVEAQNYLLEHINNPMFRVMALETAFKSGNFEEAITLAEDGIKLVEKDKPGSANDWYDRLLRIAQAQNDKESIIKYTRLLLINPNRYENDYFKILKEIVPVSDWESFFDNLIEEIREVGGGDNSDKIADLYIEEEKWDRLLEILKKHPTLYEIEKYEKYLVKDYKLEIIDFYSKGILDYLNKNKSRTDYQIACDYICRLENIGGREIADKLISELKILFKPRRALLEELNKI